MFRVVRDAPEGLTAGLTWGWDLRFCCVFAGGLGLRRGLTVSTFVNLCHDLVTFVQCVVGDGRGVGDRCWRALVDARGVSPPS